jgi:hypothetical protein
MPTNAFISYSHADEKYLERLHKHLAMLQRDGSLDAWSDHKILPGEKFNEKINSSLENSGIFLALLSPDYLASAYCYELEFKQALRMAKAGKIRIIPIILEPCEWKASPFGEIMALPKDGRAISEWTNQNNAFLDVVSGLRRVLEAPNVVTTSEMKTNEVQAVSGRRVRLKQDFDAIDKAEFADRAYETIRKYFEASCAELSEVGESLKAKFEPMSNIAFTCTVVNRTKRNGGEAHITVHNSKRERGFGDINYVYQRHADTNTSNGTINVEADDYNLYLTMKSFGTIDDKRDAKNTAEQVADILWNEFVKQAGIDYE